MVQIIGYLQSRLLRAQLCSGREEEAKADLRTSNTTESAKLLTATYESEQKPDSAWLYLQQIPADNADNTAFKDLYVQLLQGIEPPAGSGKAMSQQETLLRNMAANANNTYSVLAQSLIAAHYAEPFDKKPLAPPQPPKSANAMPTGLRLQPNPANNEVQLYIALPELLTAAQLYVSDIHGRIIDQLLVTQPKLTLQTATYPNGFYLLYLKTANGAVYTQKLAVIR